jgi:PAS domain S-box-containing protein
MEQKLKESEQKYRDIAELLPDVIYEGDLNLKLTYVNSIGFKKFGYTPKDLESGLFMVDFLDSDYKEKAMRQIKLLQEGNATKPEKYLMQKKDGTNFFARIHSRPIIKDNEVIGIRGTITDISDIILAEQKVRENEERFRRMADNIHEGLTIIEDGKILYINDEACRIFGYPHNELINLNGLELAAPEEKERLKVLREEARKSGKRIDNLKFWIIQKDGTRRCIHNHYSFGLKDNKVVNRFVITKDITEQELTERKLKESEEKYRLISETAYDLIGVLNDKFKYEYINETAFKVILGYTNEDLIGKSALEFTHPNDIASTANALIDGFKQGEGGAELRFRHKDGRWVWIEAKGKTYIDKDGKFKAIVISRDISERKLTERRLKESEKKYRDAYNRANFYQDLFAHDINNILHIISTSMELISYSLSDTEKPTIILEAEDIINKQVERGAKLVSNVHTLSKLEEEEINTQPTEICKLMKNAIEFVKKTYSGKNIKLPIECEEDHITINANELLQGVFENILLNAIKYNDNNEIIIIIKVSKTVLDNNNYYKIEFVDNGIGVPDDRKQIIFQQGNRELKGTKGMGLGLSLVKKIIKTFSGKIWVEDKIKQDFTQGSNFIILLPEFE